MAYYHQHQHQPLPSLSSILKLHPSDQPLCIGYAPSKGRLCNNRTNARNRSMASFLLDQGTKQLHAGLCIDDLLKDLAPLVLCTRNHQSQAGGLAATWQRRVFEVQRSIILSSRRTETCRGPRVIEYEEPLSPRRRREVSPPRSSGGERREASGTRSTVRGLITQGESASPVSNALVRVQRPLNQNTSAVTLESRSRASESNASPVSASPVSASPVSTLPVSTSPVSTSPVSTSPVSTSPVSTSPVSTSPVSTSPVSTSPVSTSPVSTSPVSTSPVSTSPESETTRPIQSSTSGVTRRCVEGDCSVCFLPLQEPEGTIHGDSDEEPLPNDTDGDDEEPPQEGQDEEARDSLVWCKARCGNNFHRRCINKWISMFGETPNRATCPICRSRWQS